MKLGVKITILVIILLALSQWCLVYLAYQGRLPDKLEMQIAGLYNLPAGIITDKDQKEATYQINLRDYLAHKDFLSFMADKGELPNGTDIKEAAWQRALKDRWLRNFTHKYNLSFTEEEVNEYMATLASSTAPFENFTETNYNLSWPQFRELLVEPYILENKVYVYLLDNYNDQEGIRTAQKAYEALEKGENFTAVAREFSTDQTFVDNSLWLKETDLIDFYEPIAKLAAGEFSKIVTIVGGYIIWHVESVTNDESGKVWEVKSIFIKAKSLDEFFQDYLKGVNIDRKV